MKRKYNLVEFFSGIGSQAKALKNLDVEVNTLATSEWDLHAFVAYDAIHNSTEIPEEIDSMKKEEILEKLEKYTLSNNGKEAMKFSSLKSYSESAIKRIYTGLTRSKNLVDISSVSGNDMPEEIDILTYSFPCQDLSNVGAFHGYNKGIDKNSGSRSSLLWQVGRILTEMKDIGKGLPRFLLMENVPALLSQRHHENFLTWIAELEDLGYVSKYFQLNASSFGLPQNRPRLLMVSVLANVGEGKRKEIENYFEEKTGEDIIKEYCSSPYFKKIEIEDLLRTDYSDKKLFDEAIECTPNDTVSRRKIWEDNPQLVLPGYIRNKEFDVVRTITCKQDRNPNSGNLYFDCGIEGRSKFRYLTPRECLLFMGFTDEDYDNIKKCGEEFHKGDNIFARDKVIRMAGNSIPVKLLEGIFWQILKIDEMLDSGYGYSQ